MEVSNKLVSLLKKWEGFKNYAYNDVAGLLTIGVGHLLTASEKQTKIIEINGEKVRWVEGLSADQVNNLLLQDLKPFVKEVNNLVKVPLNQNQFDALVSFIFNIGINAFKSSTLLRKLNDEEYDEVPFELLRWNKAGGKPINGLTVRRNNEIKLWNGDL